MSKVINFFRTGIVSITKVVGNKATVMTYNRHKCTMQGSEFTKGSKAILEWSDKFRTEHDMYKSYKHHVDKFNYEPTTDKVGVMSLLS